MADITPVVTPASISDDDLERAEEFTSEPFLHEGEDLDVVLAEGTPRRRAFDSALEELEEGLD